MKSQVEGAGKKRRAQAVFLDKDGTLVENVPHNVDPRQVRFMPNVASGLQRLAAAGLPLIVVTNQPGLGMGAITHRQFVDLQRFIERQLQDEANVVLTGWYTCPHRPEDGCLCRKPAAGLLRQAALEHDLELGRCWLVGDILDDVEAGRSVGCTSVLVDVGNETVWRKSALREPDHRCGDFLSAAEWIVARHAGSP